MDALFGHSYLESLPKRSFIYCHSSLYMNSPAFGPRHVRSRKRGRCLILSNPYKVFCNAPQGDSVRQIFRFAIRLASDPMCAWRSKSPSWRALAASWRLLAPTWPHPCSYWWHLGAVVARSWRHLDLSCPFLTRTWPTLTPNITETSNMDPHGTPESPQIIYFSLFL